MRPCRLPLLLLVLCGAVLADRAEAREDWFEPSAMGMGGAVRMLGNDLSVLRANPAAMSGRPIYLAGVSYSFYGRNRSHVFSSAGYDSKSSAFALGTAYSVHIETPPTPPTALLNWSKVGDEENSQDTRTTHRWEVAVAYGLLDRRINPGLSVRILRSNYRLRPNTVRVSMDTGVVFWPHKLIGLGVSFQNFIPTKDANHPTRLSAGAALSVPTILDLEVDAVIDFTSSDVIKADVHGGLAVTALQLVIIRAGYYGDHGFTENYLTWGLGVSLPIQQVTLKVDYAMRIELGPLDGPIREDRQEAPQRIWNTIGASLAF